MMTVIEQDTHDTHFKSVGVEYGWACIIMSYTESPIVTSDPPDQCMEYVRLFDGCKPHPVT